MKSPMNQRPDSEARDLTEKFIAKYTRKPAGKATRATATATAAAKTPK
jgi:hypothetical protein